MAPVLPLQSSSSLRYRRFSAAEQRAFGRFTHVKSEVQHTSTPGPAAGAARLVLRPSASAPHVLLQPLLAPSAGGSDTAIGKCAQQSSEVSTACSTPGRSGGLPQSPSGGATTEQAQICTVLNRLLPLVAPAQPSASPVENGCNLSVKTSCDSGSSMLSGPMPSKHLARNAWNAPATAGRKPSVRKVKLDRDQALTLVRRQLLERYRSLHDAFARLDNSVSRDQALGPEEFSLMLARLGIPEADSGDLFSAMDSKQKGAVSLVELVHALIDTSPEALLWELRCSLTSAGVQRHSLHKLLEMARRPRHRGKARVERMLMEQFVYTCDTDSTDDHTSTVCLSVSDPAASVVAKDSGEECTLAVAAVPSSAGGSVDEVTGQGICPPPQASDVAIAGGHSQRPDTATICTAVSAMSTRSLLPFGGVRLGRSEWLRLCAALGLTLMEGERLFELLGGQAGCVDLRKMFATLRATVAPDVSLERFAVRVVKRHGKLEKAFDSVCTQPHRLMGCSEFHHLASALDVNDRNIASLWNTLALAARTRDEHWAGSVDRARRLGAGAVTEEGDGAAPSVTEDIFVEELLAWAPDTELDSLRIQLCEHFGSLAEWRRALARDGAARHVALTPGALDAVLRDVGIKGLDLERTLSAASSACRGGSAKGGRVTLEGLIEVMQDCSRQRLSAAHSAVKDDTRAAWNQLHIVQAELRLPRKPLNTGSGGLLPRAPATAAPASSSSSSATSSLHPRHRCATDFVRLEASGQGASTTPEPQQPDSGGNWARQKRSASIGGGSHPVSGSTSQNLTRAKLPLEPQRVPRCQGSARATRLIQSWSATGVGRVAAFGQTDSLGEKLSHSRSAHLRTSVDGRAI